MWLVLISSGIAFVVVGLPAWKSLRVLKTRKDSPAKAIMWGIISLGFLIAFEGLIFSVRLSPFWRDSLPRLVDRGLFQFIAWNLILMNIVLIFMGWGIRKKILEEPNWKQGPRNQKAEKAKET